MAIGTRTDGILPGAARLLLPGALLVAMIIAGLLAMHTLTPHSSIATDQSTAIASPSDPAPMSHGAPDDAELSGGCADCASDGLPLAGSCALALLLAFLGLARPGLTPGTQSPRCQNARRWRDSNATPIRTPSLQVLCISRT